MESKKGGVQGYRETGHSPRELSREGSEPLGCRVRMMHTLSSVVLFSAFLSPSEVPGNGRGVVVVTSLLLLPPHPWHQPHLRDLLCSGDPRPELETPCLQGRSHPGRGGGFCTVLPAAPSLSHELTALRFAPFWLCGLGFLIHHRSQRLQSREQSAGRELRVAPGHRLQGQDPRAFGVTAQPRTHIFLVILPFLAFLVGHNDTCPEGLEHGVAPVGCCWGTDTVRGVWPQDVRRRGAAPARGRYLQSSSLTQAYCWSLYRGELYARRNPGG